MELSSLEELESGQRLSVDESSNEKNHEQTDLSMSVTKEQLAVTTAQFATVSVKEHAQIPETIEADVPTEHSVACSNSQATCSMVCEATLSVLPSDGPSSVAVSPAVLSDGPSQCFRPGPPTDPQKAAELRRKKRNKPSKQNDATSSSGDTAGR